MPKKGTSNNPNGRPKGRANKITTEVREWLKNLIDNNREQIEKDFKAVDAKTRLYFFEKILQYTTPKMQNIEAKIDLERLEENQIQNIATTILEGIKEEENKL